MNQKEQQPSFDFDQLARAVGGDRDLMRHFATAFAENTALYVEELAHCFGGGGGNWARAAHKLKGAANTVGARRLAALAAEAEGMPAACDARSEAISAIEAEVNNLRQILDDWMAR